MLLHLTQYPGTYLGESSFCNETHFSPVSIRNHNGFDDVLLVALMWGLASDAKASKTERPLFREPELPLLELVPFLPSVAPSVREYANDSSPC